MIRYYIEPTGVAQGRTIGLILNRDGSVYTGGMGKDNPEPAISNPSIHLLAYDGIEIEIKGDLKKQTVDLIFNQTVGDETSVVAALRFSSTEELEKFLDKICNKAIDFKSGQLFEYEAKRQQNSQKLSRFFN